MKISTYFTVCCLLASSISGCGGIERNTAKVSYENLDMGKKLPMSIRISFPPSVDKLKLSSSYESTVVVNNERQSDRLTINMGSALKDSFISALKGRFAEVHEEGSAVKDTGAASFNPYNTTVMLEIEPEQPQSGGAGAGEKGRRADFITTDMGAYSLTMKAKVKIKSITGEVYETYDYIARGSGKLSGGGTLAAGLAAKLTLGLASGPMAGQQLANGAEELIGDLIRQTLQNLNADFAAEFTEFTAYSAAMKSKSPNDLQSFLDKYPRGKRARKVAEALDTQMYEFAKSTNMLESNIEYLDKMPKGKYRAEMKAKVEPMMYGEIAKGNTFFCKKYLELLPDGDNAGDVRKRCAGL